LLAAGEFCGAFFAPEMLTALFQVVMIDLVLAGDNAIVIGLSAAGLPGAQRSKAVLIGIGAATLLRLGFASVTAQLLQIVGLLLAGGILLLWVCWKMWRELRASKWQDFQSDNSNQQPPQAASKSLAQASWQILVADAYPCPLTTFWPSQELRAITLTF
jgi:YjbE family integral membrane protein